ncbi:pea pathogenicity protein, partial [Periconia macrospinosa]
SRKYWLPSEHLCVDEAIARFTGRATEIVIIRTKPTPQGFKVWTLANDAYVLDWLFH